MIHRDAITGCARVIALIGCAIVGIAGCAGEVREDQHQREPMEEDYRTVEQGVPLSDLDRGCSTSGTQGISAQLLGEMQCLSDGALVPVSDPNIEPTSSRVHLYLSPEGRKRLKRAASRATIRVNSALRTIAEQYVLEQGCPVAATPGESNHETGRAVDVDNWRSVGDILKAEGLSQPLPSSDPVHFEAPGPDLRDKSVLAFQKLWNENHPNDQIAEDGITGPETLSRLARAPAGGFRDGRVCRDENDDDASLDAAIAVSIDGGASRVEQGSSKGKPDFLPGETATAYIRLTNASDVVWEDPQLGTMFEAPFLKPVEYRIQDDHPEHDKQSWGANDANDHPKNPKRLDERSKIHLNPMSPGESKRVVVEFRAARYSFGRGIAHHPDVRGWLWHIGGIYGEQRKYHDAPSNANRIGRKIRDYIQTDVFARDQWLFRGGHADDHEGWRARGPQKNFGIDTEARALTMQVTGADAGLVSPSWTTVEADRFDELVVETRSSGGPHTIEVFFKGEGDSFSQDRVVRFRTAGGDGFHRYVVPMGRHSQWADGPVRRIRIDPFHRRAPSQGETWSFDLKQVYFQSSESKETSSRVEGISYVDGPRVELSSEDRTGGGGVGGGGDRGGRPSQDDSDSTGGTEEPRGGGGDVQTKGCSAVPGGRSRPPWHLLLLALPLALVRSGRRDEP